MNQPPAIPPAEWSTTFRRLDYELAQKCCLMLQLDDEEAVVDASNPK